MKWFEIHKGNYINLEKYDSIKIRYEKTEEEIKWKVTITPSSDNYVKTFVITDPIIIKSLRERLNKL